MINAIIGSAIAVVIALPFYIFVIRAIFSDRRNK
jgi:hypothetical protein